MDNGMKILHCANVCRKICFVVKVECKSVFHLPPQSKLLLIFSKKLQDVPFYSLPVLSLWYCILGL